MTVPVPTDLLVIAGVTGQPIDAIAGSPQAQAMGKLLIQDALTGLYNRRYLQQRLAMELHARHGGQGKVSLCMLDLNNFKQINDNHGHAAGDAILAEVGHALGHRLPTGCFAVRYGGDEFVVVMPDFTATAAAAAMHKLLGSFVGDMAVAAATGAGPALSFSVGLSTWPDDAGDYAGLLEVADQAMYEQKQRFYRGRGDRRRAPPVPAVTAGVRPPMVIPDGLATLLCCQLPDEGDAVPGPTAGCLAIVRFHVEVHGGFVCSADRPAAGLIAAFPSATAALAAAGAARESLLSPPTPPARASAARMALYTGEAEFLGGTYHGPAVERCRYLLTAASAGQAVLSAGTVARIGADVPAGLSLRDLGRHRLADLQTSEHLFQLLQPELPADFPPLNTLDSRPHNLSMQNTSFVGRECELGRIADLLAASSLLVVLGPAGTGKSRLAVQAAARLLPRFNDGVWLIELSTLADPALLPQVTAQALGVTEAPAQALMDTLLKHLRQAQALLVVDNCEHLAVAAAEFLARIQAGCPGVRLLVTSRVPLGMRDETVLRLAPLNVPAANGASGPADGLQYDAVRLFVDRARRSRPGFELTAENAGPVAEICRRLDGLPLALELAAARAQVLSPAEIAGRLADRFRLLTGDTPDPRSRPQTLRATMDWSHDLLSDPEQRLWRRLAVFNGTFSAAAVEAVCGTDGLDPTDILNLLQSLVEKGLVMAEEQAQHMRFRLLETVRAYGLEQLRSRQEEVAMRRRHLRWAVDCAEGADAHLRGPAQETWLERLDLDHDNLRAALDWTQSDPDSVSDGLKVAGSLLRYWFVRGHLQEGREYLARLLAVPTVMVAPAIRAQALRSLGVLAANQGDYDYARSVLARGLVLARRTDDRHLLASLLTNLGSVYHEEGNYPQAWEYYEERLQLSRALGDRPGIAIGLLTLGDVAHRLGYFSRATDTLEQAIAHFEELGDSSSVAYGLLRLGCVAADQGQVQRALALLRKSLTMRRDLQDRHGMAASLEAMAAALATVRDPDRPARLLGAAATIREQIGAPLPHRDQHEVATTLAAVATYQGQAAADRAWQEGRALSMAAAVACALGDHHHCPRAEAHDPLADTAQQ